jgi:Mn2+/Fe2+ NRAMP family transporter
MVRVPWGEAAYRLVVPSITWNKDYLTTIVAVFGTTISPYLFFWQASQEAEDVRETPRRRPLTRAPNQGSGALERIELDTLVGMGISNMIALAIMITAAATLNVANVTDIQTSAQAAEALRPIAGSMAEIVFALGVLGTGLLAILFWQARLRTRSGKPANGPLVSPANPWRPRPSTRRSSLRRS